jgi:hypothetical protein
MKAWTAETGPVRWRRASAVAAASLSMRFNHTDVAHRGELTYGVFEQRRRPELSA